MKWAELPDVKRAELPDVKRAELPAGELPDAKGAELLAGELPADVPRDCGVRRCEREDVRRGERSMDASCHRCWVGQPVDARSLDGWTSGDLWAWSSWVDLWAWSSWAWSSWVDLWAWSLWAWSLWAWSSWGDSWAWSWMDGLWVRVREPSPTDLVGWERDRHLLRRRHRRQERGPAEERSWVAPVEMPV